MSFVSCTAASLTDSLFGLITNWSESIQYSPNKQHAMIFIHGLEGALGNAIIFVDLLNRTRSERIYKFEWNLLLHVYWLSNDLISVFNEIERGHFIHFVYKFRIENGNVQLELIQKTYIPHQDRNYSTVWGCSFQDPCKLKLNGHDFLFVKSYSYLLIPFNPLNGPCLPSLSLNIIGFINEMRSQGYHIRMQCMFACYNNSVYFYVNDGKEYTFDRLLEIDIVDFNLISRKIQAKRGNLDKNNINLIIMNKKTKGLFTMSGIPHIWQNEQYAVAYEFEAWHGVREDRRRLVIINLENKSVIEKMVKFRFSLVTIYKGFLLFWQVPDSNGKISFKFEWLGENMQTLSDICSVKMLSQPVKNNQFKQFYKHLMDN